jgi:hypothetical protein
MSEMNELATALAAAQLEMHNPRFDRVNPAFKSKYASLASVRDAVIPVLAKHGIACVQNLHTTGEGIACTTVLIHKSGQQIQCTLSLPADKMTPQGLLSAGTYAKRALLQSMTVCVGDEDDDGNAAEASLKPHPAMVGQAPSPDYSVQRAALEHCATLSTLQQTWKALSAAERRALSDVKDQAKARIEMADAAAADA